MTVTFCFLHVDWIKSIRRLLFEWWATEQELRESCFKNISFLIETQEGNYRTCEVHFLTFTLREFPEAVLLKTIPASFAHHHIIVADRVNSRVPLRTQSVELIVLYQSWESRQKDNTQQKERWSLFCWFSIKLKGHLLFLVLWVTVKTPDTAAFLLMLPHQVFCISDYCDVVNSHVTVHSVGFLHSGIDAASVWASLSIAVSVVRPCTSFQFVFLHREAAAALTQQKKLVLLAGKGQRLLMMETS